MVSFCPCKLPVRRFEQTGYITCSSLLVFAEMCLHVESCDSLAALVSGVLAEKLVEIF